MPDDYKISDTGSRQVYDTGAVRDNGEKKGMPNLFPFMTLKDLSIHFEKGADKYDARNWEKGIPVSRFMDSAFRHYSDFILGDIEENHLIAAIWNLCCAYDTLKRIEVGLLPNELDDLPYPLRERSVAKRKDEARETIYNDILRGFLTDLTQVYSWGPGSEKSDKILANIFNQLVELVPDETAVAEPSGS